jgi:tetratricopeptide (TPR) repeat protein
VAHYLLGCLLYYRERPGDAVRHWEAAADINPRDFSTRRALGLAYGEQGAPVEKATAQLEKAVELNPAHLRTLNDLSAMYARAGHFDEQLVVLQKALARSPQDDDLAEGVLTAFLIKGQYQDAAQLIERHTFAPRHRSYGLRDKYRMMRYGTAAQAFNRGDYSSAFEAFAAALRAPVSLGIDDFQSQGSPRVQYYLGLTLEALARKQEAREAYEKGVAGAAQLSGDRDSWNSENFFMVLSLARLGRESEAARLRQRFEDFARDEAGARNARHRAEANYLLGLVEKSRGHGQEAQARMAEAVKAVPDFLPARLELRGDVPQPR